MRIFVYILGASKNPNKIECRVPYRINDDLIFFGPCKKRLRELLKKDWDVKYKNEEIYFVGLNASNTERIRKIVWAGKIVKALSFENAYTEFINDDKYNELLELSDSPMHVKPLFKNNILLGYELVKELHFQENAWISDLSSDKNLKNQSEDNIILPKKLDDLDRDICFLMENMFYADSNGIDISEQIISLFKNVQTDKCKEITSYAIFGKRNDNSTDGKTGRWLEIDNTKICQDLISLIENAAENITSKDSIIFNHSKKCNHKKTQNCIKNKNIC